MKRLNYKYKQKKRASTLLALCLSELEAAELLVEKELFREAVTHLYFTCFYASQALLIQHLRSRPSHRSVESQLNRSYGRKKGFPRRYIELHRFLHTLRTQHAYRTSHIPNPRIIEGKLRVLRYYVKFVFKVIPKIETLEIINGVYESNKEHIKIFSYDIYCPQTYSNHTRITFWQPPFYRQLYAPCGIGKNRQEDAAQFEGAKHQELCGGSQQ